ncbi:MAG: AP-3 complex subunit delta [Pycnora praestabilis]|nr:MAG: AP-3 complex subunit delta [Pycnora praestabilis]
MSWASFHVLEVMSSAKYLQKRVGYLGAVQSFRPDTEVLMLATNLLKKDLTSPLAPFMSLPLITIPHIITPSFALSLLSDLLPRISHSQPAIRKKTIVNLYRLALVYPETLRVAWPKIKERLMDENEDSSVTAAIINVVCELGWRRPQDFLPLAPRLFDLLVDGGNNWMAIKIIKLFATLTPLEPRLIRKLLPPLTNIIRTTPAMSLLYECINGLIQGGILESADGTDEGEDIASLCVSKLRGMIVLEGDSNLKYVALLAFNRIVVSHPHLVSVHQDVILDCIDDADISIRLRALDLVVGMVNSDNIMSVVGRLMRQLRNSPIASPVDDSFNDRGMHNGVEPAADSDDEDPEERLKPAEKIPDQPPPLPIDYRIGVIRRILEMCSRDTYTNIIDFEWYVDVLVQLARYIPAPQSGSMSMELELQDPDHDIHEFNTDISYELGTEIRNVAVRVRSIRPEATKAAEMLVLVGLRDRMFPSANNGGQGVLSAAAWIVGEYADYLADRNDTLDSLIHASTLALPADVLSIYLQAIPKVFVSLTGDDQTAWTAERRSVTSLLMARVVHFLEPLVTHPNLEVQERSVELLELMRLAAEAVSGQEVTTQTSDLHDPPLLLTQAIPSLFTGLELNPVAVGAQRKIPVPEGLELDMPINLNLPILLQTFDDDSLTDMEHDDSELFYNQQPVIQSSAEPAVNRLNEPDTETSSYQHLSAETSLGVGNSAIKRAERRERNKDDPFYIANEDLNFGTSTPLHNILKNSNGENVDIDSIPIMNLDLNEGDGNEEERALRKRRPTKKRKQREKIDIMVDENFAFNDPSSSEAAEKQGNVSNVKQKRAKKSLLQVDSSGLSTFALESGSDVSGDRVLDVERQQREEEDMAKAMREVERLRLEMQRASERIQATQGIPPEGTLVKKKKKKKKTLKASESGATVEDYKDDSDSAEARETSVKLEASKQKKKKKKKQRKEGPQETVADGDEDANGEGPSTRSADPM